MAKGHKKTTSVTADKATTDMQNRVYGASQDAAKKYTVLGADPNTTAAMSLFGDLGGYGRTGAAALAGDADATQQLMNPYLQQVLDAYRAEFGHGSDMLRKNVNSAATSAGAFGGDRAALEQGALQGELGRAYGGHVAGLLQGGFQDMIARAGGLANLGLTAGQNQFTGGEYLRGVGMEQANPELMRANILASGLQSGNVGNKTQTDYTKTSALQNILGGAATIHGLFGGKMPSFGGGSALSQFDPSMLKPTMTPQVSPMFDPYALQVKGSTPFAMPRMRNPFGR